MSEPNPEIVIHLNLLMVLDWSTISEVILLLLLIFFSALISGSEIAYFSLPPSDVDENNQNSQEDNNSLVNKLRSHPRKLIAVLLICSTFLNVCIAILFEHLINKYTPPSRYADTAAWFKYNLALDSFTVEQISNSIYYSIVVIIVSAFIILFGEIIPKIYSQTHNVKIANKMALPLYIADKLFKPFTYILVGISNKVEKRLIEKHVNIQNTSKADLDAAIDLAVSNDNDSTQEAGMLKGIIKFNDVIAKQVMTPRMDVMALDFNSTFSEVLQAVKEFGFSRMPIYNEDVDNVAGLLYAKDLIAHIGETDEFEWQGLIRTNVLYVPESRKINELLDDFQEKRTHFAIVVDEYGGSSGIVTLEDIMEEIVGEINDEFDDQEDLNFVRLDTNNYLFDGKTLINDMCRVLGQDTNVFDSQRGNADSIAGLLLEITGELPRKDQEIKINAYTFKVVQVSKKRIEQIKITIPN